MTSLPQPFSRPRARGVTAPNAGKVHWAWIGAGVGGAMLATVLLVGSQLWLQDAAKRKLQADSQLREANRLDAENKELSDRNRSMALLLEESKASGMDAASWNKRKFNLKQVAMSRDAVNSLLDEVTRSSGSVFGAEEFEITVRKFDEGLFNSPKDPSSTIEVTLKGALMFRRVGGAAS
jgi:hypothetical protein